MKPSSVQRDNASTQVPQSRVAVTQDRNINAPLNTESFAKSARMYIDTHKTKINYATNGTAAFFNLFTFIEGNWNLTGINIESLEKISTFFSKCATGIQGVLSAVDTWKKQNFIPLVGYVLEVPVAIFSSGNNLWLFRGLTQGWGQLQGVFKRRILKTKAREEKYLGDDYSGFKNWLGFKANLSELPKIVKEIYTNPLQKSQTFSRALFTCSFFQITGALIALLGLEKIGAGIRDFSGGMVDFAFMLDKDELKKNNNNDEIKIKSYVPAGIVWVGAAVVDFIKRFNDRIPNLTQLSLFFDRLASVFFVLANFDSREEDKSNFITGEELEEIYT